MRLQGRIAIVTGAARGMGKEAALLFAREGAKVAVIDLNEASVEAVAAEIAADGGNAIGIAADITSSQAVSAMVERTVRDSACLRSYSTTPVSTRNTRRA